ncbi:unnamed protein product [Notodromas monacha]|uniref:INO80 complex subunit F domain-containing protein n=1 Tax=Notodromas monacha TaxID=399045 RepID=A0A7R9BGE6_9CRUS|nr:unnamed protein product [Notodromas monacha]CAG0914807.1 unnamed protein product [Notodromas monacha]
MARVCLDSDFEDDLVDQCPENYGPELEHAYSSPRGSPCKSDCARDVTQNHALNSTDVSQDESAVEQERLKRKYERICQKCASLQKENERIVFHLQQLKRAIKRRRKERKFLMDRLDAHGDNFRKAPIAYPIEDVVDFVEETQSQVHAIFGTKQASSEPSRKRQKSKSSSDRSHSRRSRPTNASVVIPVH